jgi:hypothetical protein
MSHETYHVRYAPDLSGHMAFLVIGLGGVGLYNLFSEMALLLDNPEGYAWIHVISTHFYYYTAFLPLMGIFEAWEFGTHLTPWRNLNFVLGIASVPVYLTIATFVLGSPWYFITRLIFGMNPIFAYCLPALASGIWAAGRWLFA